MLLLDSCNLYLSLAALDFYSACELAVKSFMIQFSVRLLKLAPCLCRDLKESQDHQDSRATQVHRLVTHRLSDM